MRICGFIVGNRAWSPYQFSAIWPEVSGKIGSALDSCNLGRRAMFRTVTKRSPSFQAGAPSERCRSLAQPGCRRAAPFPYRRRRCTGRLPLPAFPKQLSRVQIEAMYFGRLRRCEKHAVIGDHGRVIEPLVIRRTSWPWTPPAAVATGCEFQHGCGSRGYR